MERQRMVELLGLVGEAVVDEESDIALLNRVHKALFIPGAALEKFDASPLRPAEEKLLYDLNVSAIYKRHKQFMKAAAGKPEVRAAVQELTDAAELLTAVSYDIGRYEKQAPIVEAQDAAKDPEKPKNLPGFLAKLDELRGKKAEMLQRVPELETRVKELLGAGN